MRKGKLLAMSLMLMGALTACGGSGSKPIDTSTSQAATTEASTTETDTTTEATTTEAETTEAETEAQSTSTPMGEVATLKDWKITVTNMQMLDSIDNGFGSFTPDAGNKYLLVTATIENTGKSAGTFLPSFGLNSDVSATVLYGDGYEFSLTQLLGYQKDLINSTINPLSSKEGNIAFEVPNSVAESTEPIVLEFAAGNDKATFSLR